jgi:hypothetical protein
MSRAFVSFVLVAAISGTLWFAFAPHITNAQVNDAASGADPITLDVSPQYPAPYQTVTISPSSSVFDITDTTVTVTLNGKAFYKGTGGSTITVPMGGPGSTADVVVTFSGDGQSPASQELVFHPESVALVVEPVSGTHPFYEGSGLVTSEGRVRIVAIPDIRTSPTHAIDPSALTYTWSLGDQELDTDSGTGKDVLDATAPQQYRDADVSVVVTSPDGSEVAQADTTISPTDPIVRIYENDPLLGPLYDNALSGTVTLNGPEETYRGVPYYFSVTPPVIWNMNGVQSGTTDNITVRSTGNGQGSAVLDFSANDSDTSQSADSTISVNFGQQQSGGIFGL